LLSLGCHSKQACDEGHLPNDISFVHPVHRFIASTPLLVSSGTEGLNLVSLNEPEDEILEQPEQHLPMEVRQGATCDGRGKVLCLWQRKLQALQRQETIGEHDQGQVSMQPISASSLEVVQPHSCLASRVKLLDH
jgi:hypothetical protein